MSEKNIELGILFFQALMSWLRNRGLTEEEIEQSYERSRIGKESRPSEDLPDA